MIWPSLLIVLTSLSRMMKIPALVFILAIVGASFAAFCLVSEKNQFFMPYSRAWELGLGAAICFLPEVAKQRFPRLRKLLPWAGFALIGAAVSRLQFHDWPDREHRCCSARCLLHYFRHRA